MRPRSSLSSESIHECHRVPRVAHRRRCGPAVSRAAPHLPVPRWPDPAGYAEQPERWLARRANHLPAQQVALERGQPCLVQARRLRPTLFGFRVRPRARQPRRRGFRRPAAHRHLRPVGLILHAIFAVLPVTAATLFSAVLLLTTSALFIAAAQNGLASTLGGQHSMSGQVSAVWSMFNTVPSILAPLAGGWLSDKLDRLALQLYGKKALGILSFSPA